MTDAVLGNTYTLPASDFSGMTRGRGGYSRNSSPERRLISKYGRAFALRIDRPRF